PSPSLVFLTAKYVVVSTYPCVARSLRACSVCRDQSQPVLYSRTHLGYWFFVCTTIYTGTCEEPVSRAPCGLFDRSASVTLLCPPCYFHLFLVSQYRGLPSSLSYVVYFV
ncbi:hypothetical protein C8R47DRAFT_1169990, partial [Mycena vitilis]